MLSKLSRGDEVAVLPSQSAGPEETIALAIVNYAGPAIVFLNDGRRYFKDDGRSCFADGGFIVLATDAHRSAVGIARSA